MPKKPESRGTVWTSSRSLSKKQLDVSDETIEQLKKELKDYPGDSEKDRRKAFSTPVHDSSFAKSVG